MRIIMSENSSPSPKTLLSRWWFWTFIAFPAAVLSVFLGSLLAHFTVGRSDSAIKIHSDTVKSVQHDEHPVSKPEKHDESADTHKKEAHEAESNNETHESEAGH